MIKKKPGRPPKKPYNGNPILYGVVENPSKHKYVIEIVYENPNNVKSVFDTIFACNKRDVIFSFYKTHLLIHCDDHFSKLKIQAHLIGSNCISYFSKKEVKYLVSSEDLKNVCNIIKKDFGNIKIYMTEENKDKLLYFDLEETSNKSNDKRGLIIRKADSASSAISADEFKFQSRMYSVSFKLISNHFKKRLTTYNSENNVLCEICYDGTKTSGIVKFKYNPIKGTSKGPITKYNKHEGLECVAYDDTITLSCMFKLEFIINIFKTIIYNEFYVLMSKEFGICFNFYLHPVTPDRLKQKYTYKDNINSNSNSIIVRIFIEKNL